MTQSLFIRDDAHMAVYETGHGLPVLFQHGLGGDEAQVAQTFPASPEFRRITLECRGHGASTLGSTRPFSIAMFAQDVLAVADHMGLDRFIVGGISMGAAIALHLAHAHKSRVLALVLVRPAWTFDASPSNMEPIRIIADFLQSFPIDEARERFATSDLAANLQKTAPDNLASLLGYFERDNASDFAEVLAGIATDGPGVSTLDVAAFAIPTLIIGNQRDAIHPLSSATALAEGIPGAHFAEVTAKATDKTRHFVETQSTITQFLTSRFSGSIKL